VAITHSLNELMGPLRTAQLGLSADVPHPELRSVTLDDGEEYSPEEIADMDRHVAEQETDALFEGLTHEGYTP
jgi:hypothetical protein